MLRSDVHRDKGQLSSLCATAREARKRDGQTRSPKRVCPECTKRSGFPCTGSLFANRRRYHAGSSLSFTRPVPHARSAGKSVPVEARSLQRGDSRGRGRPACTGAVRFCRQRRPRFGTLDSSKRRRTLADTGVKALPEPCAGLRMGQEALSFTSPFDDRSPIPRDLCPAARSASATRSPRTSVRSGSARTATRRRAARR